MSDWVAGFRADAIEADARPVVARERLLFITLHFPPSRDIGAHACEQIARYFPLYGWHPFVLTRPAHLYERRDPDYRRPFPGTMVEAGILPHPISIYRRLKQLVRRRGDSGGAGHSTTANEQAPRGLRRWILSLLHTPDIYTGWIVPATIAGMRVIRRERVGRIFSSGPFWTNHVVGAILSRLTGVPLTIHFRDPWMEVEQPKPVSALSQTIERWLERLVIRTARSVVCVTEWHTRVLRETHAHEPAAKFVTIPNGYDGAEWDGFDLDSEPADRTQFTIAYPGGFIPWSRSPRPLFRALRSLIDAHEIDPNKVVVDLFGNCDVAEGGVRVADIAAEYGLQQNVRIGGPVSRPETLRRMQQSQLLLLLAEGWTLQIPGKTYEYLRSGRPILALTAEGALADLLEKTGGAVVARPTDDAAIACAIRSVYVSWSSGTAAGKPDRRLVADFDRRRLAARYAALFNQ